MYRETFAYEGRGLRDSILARGENDVELKAKLEEEGFMTKGVE